MKCLDFGAKRTWHHDRSGHYLVLTAMLIAFGLAQAQPIQVPRYDDADDYLPNAQKRNKENARLFLRQQPTEEIFKVVSPRNVLVDVVANIPKDADVGVVIVLGGTGVLSIVNDQLDRSFSFQPRTRDFWWLNNMATFVVDAPSDRLGKAGIQDSSWRAGADHRTDMKAVLDEITKRFKGPIVLFGHSNGAHSLGNMAGIENASVKAYLFSSPAHFNNGSDALRQVSYKLPIIMVEHVKDACSVSPAKETQDFFTALKAEKKKLVWVEGGFDPISGPCGPFAQHSYFGVEKQTVDSMATEIRKIINQQ